MEFNVQIRTNTQWPQIKQFSIVNDCHNKNQRQNNDDSLKSINVSKYNEMYGVWCIHFYICI